MPAFAVEEGHSAGLAGILLSAMAVGSLLGGLWYGARHWSGPIVTRYLGLQVLFTLGLLPLLVADSIGIDGRPDGDRRPRARAVRGGRLPRRRPHRTAGNGDRGDDLGDDRERGRRRARRRASAASSCRT